MRQTMLILCVFALLAPLNLLADDSDEPGAFDCIPAPPGNSPMGLTWDGSYLWVSGEGSSGQPAKLYKVDPNTGGIFGIFDLPGTRVHDLAYLNGRLWATDIDTDLIYEIDRTTGLVLDDIPSPADTVTGLTSDGTYLWVADDCTSTAYKLHPATGSVSASFPIPDDSGGCSIHIGLAWDGSHLWFASGLSIYRIDPTTGNVVDKFRFEWGGGGLAYNGKNLVTPTGDYDYICKMHEDHWAYIYEDVLSLTLPESLDTLRRFRDLVFAHSKRGEQYVGQIYAHSTELASILYNSPALRVELSALVRRFMPRIQQRLDGSPICLSQAELQSVIDFLGQIDTEASRPLQTLIAAGIRDLRDANMLLKFGVALRP